MKLRWPRGRWNGRRIVGVSFKVKVDFAHWLWVPVQVWRLSGGVHWLCFYTWTEWVYEDG